MGLEFCSLSSGSSGNCYYLGNGFRGILIDAGISAGSIRKYLKAIQVPMQTIMGVLVTHNHSDHIRGLDVLTRRSHLPVFTSEGVWKSIHAHPAGHDIPADCIRNITLGKKFMVADFEVEAFPVNHDAPETLGYHLKFGGQTVTLVTDLGHICETAAQYIKAANILIIESNYDEEMLENGSYPYYLKKRIQSDHGHLGNHQTAEFLSDNLHDEVHHIFLAHLSKQNNTPDKALQSLMKRLGDKNLPHCPVSVLPRGYPSEVWEFETA